MHFGTLFAVSRYVSELRAHNLFHLTSGTLAAGLYEEQSHHHAWGCCIQQAGRGEVSSVPPGPASSESERVFPVRTHTHTPSAYVYMRTRLATRISPGGKHSTHANTNSTDGLVLFPSPAEQNERQWKLHTNIYNMVHSSRHSIW